MVNPVTVVIPVGPNPVYKGWLPEALASLERQTMPVGEILLIDDGANLAESAAHVSHDVPALFEAVYPTALKYRTQLHNNTKYVFSFDETPETYVSYWQPPWNLGFSAAFNCGVGLALFDNILYLAADDTYGPECVADCLEVWNQHGQKDAWYSLTYESPSGGVCAIPINAAMITRNLWRWMGGFPPSAFAGPDALMLSRLMVHAPDRIIRVKPGKVNYHIREHPGQETHHQASFFLDEMNSIRNKETARFVPNAGVILK